MPGIQDHLDACLAELPKRERDAVVLHHLAGHTLAEVARQTGCGLSTVHDRIARGLGRLRTLLAKRGVALSAVALAAALATEAQAAVPAEVLVHLRDLAHAGGGAGSTAVLSDRVRRWSRPRSSTMTRVTIAAAGALLVGGAAWQFLTSAEAGAPKPATTPPTPAPKPAWTATGDPIRDLDPEHARTWIIIRANDGARTIERLRSQPEMALLPAAWQAGLDELATLREASFAIDQDSMLPEVERVRHYRLAQEMAGLTPAQQQERALAEIQRAAAKPAPKPQAIGQEEKEEKEKEEENPGQQPDVAFSFTLGKPLPAFSGLVSTASAESPLLARLRAALAAPQSGTKPIGPNAWSFPTMAGDGRIAVDGSRITITAAATASPAPAAIAARASRAATPGAELEYATYLDPGRPGLAPVRTVSGSLLLGADGLRFTSTTSTGHGESKGPSLDRQCFARVPAMATLAGAVALHPGAAGSATFSRSLITTMGGMLHAWSDGTTPAGVTAALNAIELLLAKADGTMLAWLEPGVPMPSLSIEVDLARADADAVIAASGLPRAGDGTATMQAGLIGLCLGWQDGRLVITTHPLGIAGLDHAGGFTAQPEIQRALAAMPAGSIGACALLRPVATLDLAMPFADLMNHPGLQELLIDYTAALAKRQSYGFITSASTGTTSTVEAGGILALVGYAMLVRQAIDPASRAEVVN